MKLRATTCLCLFTALLSLRVAPALGQDEGAPPPWHQGVSAERKQRARELFREARDLHRRMMLGDARAKYEEALTYWEQPELRLYLARVLKSMGLPLPAYESLRLALRWGPKSLHPEDEESARTMMAALVKQELSAVEIRCDEPGAAVQLDGRPWFVGPGSERRMVLPGEHVITARKEGYYPLVKAVLLLAGRRASGVLELSVDGMISEPAWPALKPGAVVAGGGVAIGVLGAVLQWQADEHHNEAERRFQEQCGAACAPASSQGRGEWERYVALGCFIAGGAAVATGAGLAWFNWPRSYRREDRGGVELTVVPLVSTDGGGFAARLPF